MYIFVYYIYFVHWLKKLCNSPRNIPFQMLSISIDYTVLYKIVFIQSLKNKIGYFSVSDQKLTNLSNATVTVFSALK